MNNEYVNVTESPFNAVGDGLTCDRKAIQDAIDFVHSRGGGTVRLPGGRIYLTGDIELKSNVTLEISHGAVLKQSKKHEDYAHAPLAGCEFEGTGNMWDGKYHYNYPHIFAASGTSNIKITGGGTIEQDNTSKALEDNIYMSAIGFFDVSGFEISDVHIKYTHGYNIALRRCRRGLVKGITVSDPEFGASDGWSTDGVSMQNCQDIRVTGCCIVTSDDLIYIWTSYKDPRGRNWWNSDCPQPTRNIEVDHNICRMIMRKKEEWGNGFGIIPWGGICPEPEKIEISDIYVHDNIFIAPHPIGSIGPDVYYKTNKMPRARNLKFSNNILIPQEDNKNVWFETLQMENVTFDFTGKDKII